MVAADATVTTMVLTLLVSAVGEKEGGYYHVKPVVKSLFNTSISIGVPLFSFTVPRKGGYDHYHYDYGHDHDHGSSLESILYSIDPLNQLLYGLVGFGLVALLAIFAMLVGNEVDDARRLLPEYYQSNQLVMGLVHSDVIGLHPKPCLRKALCQANRLRHTNLIFAFLLPYVFPYKEEKDEPSTTCDILYNCLFDPMALIEYVAAYIADWVTTSFN